MKPIKIEIWRNNKSGDNTYFDTTCINRYTDIVYKIRPIIYKGSNQYIAMVSISCIMDISIPCKDFEDARARINTISEFLNGLHDDIVDKLIITDNSKQDCNIDIDIMCEYSQKERDGFRHWYSSKLSITSDTATADDLHISRKFDERYTDNHHMILPYIFSICNDKSKYLYRKSMPRADFNFMCLGDTFALKCIRYRNFIYYNNSDQDTDALINDLNSSIYNIFKSNLYDDYRIDEYRDGDEGKMTKVELYGILDNNDSDRDQQLLISLSENRIEIFADDEDSDYFIFENNVPKNKEVK